MKKLLAVLLALSAPAGATDYQPLVKAAMNKVVTIRVEGIGTPKPTILDLIAGKTPEEGPMGFMGSGAIIRADGIILTCDHLFLHKLSDRKVIVKLASGKEFKAIVIDEDKKKDLATLKIFPLHKLKYFTFGQTVHKGQEVVSFGSPLGFEKTASFGHVENLGIKDAYRPRTLHSASINPGNSGGPLVDATGHLVGVNIESYGGEALHLAVSLTDIHSFLGE